MKLKKTLITITICTIFTVVNFAVIGFASPSNNAITTLQNQIKNLQKQLNEKNETIKKIQSQTSVQPLNMKFVFNGSVKDTQYTEDNITVPEAFSYNGIIYSPVKFIVGNLSQSSSYDSKSKTEYIGINSNSSGNFNDLSSPFYKEDNLSIYANKAEDGNPLRIGGNDYSNGCFMYSPIGPRKASYNLSGKYHSLSGIIGLDDSCNNEQTTVEFYSDDKLLGKYVLVPGSLQQNFNIDLTGVIKLDIKITPESLSSGADLVNVVIK